MRPFLLCSLAALAIAAPQRPLTAIHQHHAPLDVVRALQSYDDPVDALLAVKPELERFLEEPRLLKLMDKEVWATEGDKFRLHRAGLHFMDVTDHREEMLAGRPNLPKLSHQAWVKPTFQFLSSDHMRQVLEKMTSFYNRYYHAQTGVESARWLHDHIQSIIHDAPMATHISLEWHTHVFPQSSIISRFEPVIRNASAPLTIIGAHQDSANYYFPLLPAPGADDDMSGSTSILEAFRALAMSGFIPETPVEFHWYAAEEAGLLGSLDIAKYKKESNAKIGAMMEFDMTAFVARNHTPSMVFIKSEADDRLTEWAHGLAKEYIDLPSHIASLPAGAGSDYMSFTRYGYPSCFASEGDPTIDAGNGGLGEYEPYVHTSGDRMDIDDESGVFSIEHAKEFSKLAIAFAVEQGGWSDRHTRRDDNDKDRRAW